MTNKEKYKALCAKESGIPLFSNDWWLDAICGKDGWDVAVIEHDSEIQAALPYAIQRVFGLPFLHMPSLTQTLGPWLLSSNGKYAKQLARQKDMMELLIQQLPPYISYKQKWHYSQTNWLPFHWKGFRQTTRYTYVLDLQVKKDELWDGLMANIRSDIRKAEGRFNVTVHNESDIEEFLSLNRHTFKRQGLKQPYSNELVRRLDEACASRKCRKIWVARDAQGAAHAAIYVVWDQSSAYYLMGGSNPALRNSGATSLCLWHAICHAQNVTMMFDFEGSMIEPVERFFRAFGARQVPFFYVNHTPSRFFRVFQSILQAVKDR